MRFAEKNARNRALARYRDWLLRRYQRLDVVELSDQTEAADPISLRQIYVPVRLDSEDIADDDAFKGEGGEFIDLEKEELPGDDAFDDLIEAPMVLLSGRPGSGKTTFVHAVVVALADREAGTLRRELGAVPVPFILRRLERPEEIRCLDDLFDAWWPETERQAEKDDLPLDRELLEAVLRPDRPAHFKDQPVLLLFDGIDEMGGPETRQRILEVAFEARAAGYRLLVTGRPTGYADLSYPSGFDYYPHLPFDKGGLRLHYMQPFAWPQVKTFISKWYLLRDDWRADAEQGIRHFLEHLAEPHRRPLLVLARRPIFLALMALVNCTENRMPEGRAKLYERIVELYLGRQERFRQRKAFTDGSPIPRWTPDETRRVLAAVAAVSMEKGSASPKEDQQRFLWRRADLEETVRGILQRARFPTLREDDAATLVKFFLNPAGLLVEPSEGEIQFAHLSFQEYLCAVDFYERAKQWEDGVPDYSEKEFFPLLDRPGWGEVGILYLCVHSHATVQQGHLALLRRLEPANSDQAALYVTALAGRELEFTEQERRSRLPVALMCALLHPGRDLEWQFRNWSGWTDDGLDWIVRLLEATDAEGQWQALEGGATDLLRNPAAAREKWLASKADSRAQSLVQLAADSGWGLQANDLRPIADEKLERSLASFVRNRSEECPLWTRDDEQSPQATDLALELDRLVSAGEELHRAVAESIPLDVTWLQGDNADAAQPAVLFLFHGPQNPYVDVLLPCVTQQLAVLCEFLGSSSESASLSRSLSRSLYLSIDRSRSRSRSLDRSLYRSRSLDRSLSRSLSLSLYRSLSLSRSLYLSRSLSRSLSLQDSTQKRFESWLEMAEKNDSKDDAPLEALVPMGLHHGADEWFKIQASNPDLERRRGLVRGEPLPREFGLFDEGRPKTVQRRAAVEALREWVADPDRVLDWVYRREVFDGELDAETRARLRQEIETLNGQPWGATAYLDAVLADWPEDQEEMDVSVEAAERRLVEALQAAGF